MKNELSIQKELRNLSIELASQQERFMRGLLLADEQAKFGLLSVQHCLARLQALATDPLAVDKTALVLHAVGRDTPSWASVLLANQTLWHDLVWDAVAERLYVRLPHARPEVLIELLRPAWCQAASGTKLPALPAVAALLAACGPNEGVTVFERNATTPASIVAQLMALRPIVYEEIEVSEETLSIWPKPGQDAVVRELLDNLVGGCELDTGCDGRGYITCWIVTR